MNPCHECSVETWHHRTTAAAAQQLLQLLKHIEWTLYQYRIDFSPQCASSQLLQGLFNEHKKIFGGFLFDDTQLFMVNKLRSNQPTLQSRHERTGDIFEIRIVQVLNLVLRRMMAGLNLQLVGRNLFNAAAKIAI